MIVECQSIINWYEIFEGVTLSDGTPIQVEQTVWDDLSLISYHDCGVQATCARASRPHKGTSQEIQRNFTVDFVLLRSVTRSIKGQDSRNKLFTLMHGNVPSVNSLMSAYVCLERATVFGALKGIQQKLGNQKFPLISQTLYGEHRSMLITPDFPLVAKVGAVHAGYGKMKCDTSRQFADFKSVVALHGDYVTAEPFIDWDYDMRIQKIGPNYRAFRRVSSNWKGNVGNESFVEDMDLTEDYKQMVDECAKLFGGLEILGLDLVHCKDGKEYILELNDTAIGLVHKHTKEDMGFMRDIVVTKMDSLFVKNVAPVEQDNSTSLEEKVKILETQLRLEKEKFSNLQKTIEEAKEEGSCKPQ
uniref:ATP-grasp domain-containing protein n=1 Tax=Arcella intermedia TaxID=1963864 RepID=A0A6B2L819_9EUKA